LVAYLDPRGVRTGSIGCIDALRHDDLCADLTGVEQKVTVQHVSVQEGGQAIVGNVTQSPREPAPEKVAASPPALTDARTAPMPIIEEAKEGVRIPAQRRSK